MSGNQRSYDLIQHPVYGVMAQPLPRDQRCGICQQWALELLTVSRLSTPSNEVVFTGCARCWGEALFKTLTAHGAQVGLVMQGSVS